LIKRLRYTLELVRPLLPTAVPKELLRRLEELQSNGGRFHDLELLYQEGAPLREKHPKHKLISLLVQQVAQLAEGAREQFLSGLRILAQSNFEAKLFSFLDPAKAPPTTQDFARLPQTPGKTET
jgi:CHAD domain-containing protein